MPDISFAVRIAVSLAMTITLAACGGGGGGSATPAPVAVATTPSGTATANPSNPASTGAPSATTDATTPVATPAVAAAAPIGTATDPSTPQAVPAPATVGAPTASGPAVIVPAVIVPAVIVPIVSVPAVLLPAAAVPTSTSPAVIAPIATPTVTMPAVTPPVVTPPTVSPPAVVPPAVVPPAVTPPVTLPVVTPPATDPTPVNPTVAPLCPIPGSNVSGGEFTAQTLPGRYGYEYIYPQQAEVDLLKSLNLRLMRVPFLWERLQPTASAPLDAAELARLDEVVRLAGVAGMTVVLDVHNYGYYNGVQLAAGNASPTALPDLWSRLAAHYASNRNVAFGLMNEPNDIDATTWAAIVQRTLAAIRATGATNTVMIPGTYWDGASSWTNGDPSNASTLLPVGANDRNVVFEVHQYFDTGFSGTSDTCTAASDAVTALSNISSWARTNHVKLFLGEFGVSQRPECVAALDRALTTIETNGDVWYGYTYWTAGAWWGNYMFNIEIAGGTPQGAMLKRHAASCPAVI